MIGNPLHSIDGMVELLLDPSMNGGASTWPSRSHNQIQPHIHSKENSQTIAAVMSTSISSVSAAPPLSPLTGSLRCQSPQAYTCHLSRGDTKMSHSGDDDSKQMIPSCSTMVTQLVPTSNTTHWSTSDSSKVGMTTTPRASYPYADCLSTGSSSSMRSDNNGGNDNVNDNRPFDDTNDTSIDYIRAIRSCSALMLAIVNDVLEMEKLQAGKGELITTPFDLHEVIKSVTTVYRYLYPYVLMK
jgi:signal transduction histidine kinase